MGFHMFFSFFLHAFIGFWRFFIGFLHGLHGAEPLSKARGGPSLHGRQTRSSSSAATAMRGSAGSGCIET